MFSQIFKYPESDSDRIKHPDRLQIDPFDPTPEPVLFESKSCNSGKPFGRLQDIEKMWPFTIDIHIGLELNFPVYKLAGLARDGTFQWRSESGQYAMEFSVFLVN